MRYTELKQRLAENRYLVKIRRKNRYPSGLRRKMYTLGGVIAVCIRHRFCIWDYLKEAENVKKNGYIFNFQKCKREIRMYLPQYEVDYLQYQIVNYAEFYETEELDFLRKNVLKPGMVILDIGANIGNHTVYFGSVCRAASIHSFEPVRDFYDILCRNVSLNGLNDVVKTHNIALGKDTGKARIRLFRPQELGSTQIEAGEDGDMDIKRLDDFRFDQIDFIKIDVEKSEYDLLLGAEKTLMEHSPVIFIEIFCEKYDQVNRLLNRYGYRCYRELPGNNYLYGKHNN